MNDDDPISSARTTDTTHTKTRKERDNGLTQALTQVIKSRGPKTRIESLTDLIFGLALSIGSVSQSHGVTLSVNLKMLRANS